MEVLNWFGTLEQELARNLALSVTYQGNKASNLPLALNTNLAPAGRLPLTAGGSGPRRIGPILATATSSSRRRLASSATTAWSRC